MGKTVEIKSPDSLQAYTMILFLRRDVISVLIISCSETQWGIWGTFRFSGIPKKPILNPFSTISSIIESFVMSFQFSLKFLMLPATNSDVLPLLLSESSFWEVYCSTFLSISSLKQSPSGKNANFLEYWLQMLMAWIVWMGICYFSHCMNCMDGQNF